MAGLKIVTDTDVEPIALDIAKVQLRIDADDTSRDALITLYIQSARETAEMRTARSFIQRSYREYFDGFPGNRFSPAYELSGGLYAPSWHREHLYRRRHFELSRSPLASFTQIQYLDPTDPTGVAILTVPASVYVVNEFTDQEQAPATITLAYGQCWPVPLRQANCVWIDYAAGYSMDGSGTPASAQNAMLLLINHYYENPDAVQQGLPVEIPYAIKALLDQNRIYYQA